MFRTWQHGLWYLVLLPLSLAGASTLADNDHDGQVKELKALRANPESPTIDGNLDEAIWNSPDLDFGRDFIQRNPDDGQPASESTLVAIAYDDHSVYVGFWCYDSHPDKIARQLVRRDREAQSDAVAVRFDGFHDHQNGYGFQVSAAGVQSDWRIYNDGWSDMNWDGVWSSAVKMQPWGWSAEMEIPFHCLRFPEGEDQLWGLQFSRDINRRAEDNWWCKLSNTQSGFVSRFGHLTGLNGIKPTRHLEVLPFGVSSYETERESVANPDGQDYYGNMGLDVKWGLSSNLILDATFNPDFGQVELDQPVLNLSTFETYFGERRPFFVEGSDLFDTRFSLFYSRRIGRQPQGDVADPGFLQYTSRLPKSTTILSAGKLTGKLSSGTSIAVLTAVTQEEKRKYNAEVLEVDHGVSPADTILIDTVTREGVVEPMAGYTAIRVRQDIMRRSSFGGLFTVASQDQFYPAVTGGLDWRLFTFNGVWSFCGQTVFSRVDPEETGFGFDADLEKESGKHLRFNVGASVYDQNLDLNRLGYLNRPNYRQVYTWWQYRTDDDWWIIRNSQNNINLNWGRNYQHQEIYKGWNFNNWIEFINHWEGGGYFGGDYPEYDDRETRGRGSWKLPSSWYGGVWLDTDQRKKFQVELDYSFGESRTSPWWGAEVLFRFKPVSNFEFWTHWEYVHDYGQLRWVDNDPEINEAPTDSTLFAYDDQDIVRMQFGATLTLRTDLSVQFSAEALSSGLDYYDYRPWLGEDSYGQTYNDHQVGNSYDYLYSAVNSMFLLRWEYLPGSTLYAVWTRSRWQYQPGTTGFIFNRDFDRFVSGIPRYGDMQNVFLVKISYWLNI
jgi:hypothetical protein